MIDWREVRFWGSAVGTGLLLAVFGMLLALLLLSCASAPPESQPRFGEGWIESTEEAES